MKIPNRFIGTLALATASLVTFAQTGADHSQHHPEEPAKKAAPAKSAKPQTNTPKQEPSAALVGMGNQMKTMRAMHDKMMAAKSPEERKALMGDHMKVMQESMNMMMPVGEKGPKADKEMSDKSMAMMGMHSMMEKRMEMMTMMMQMMMDQMNTAK